MRDIFDLAGVQGLLRMGDVVMEGDAIWFDCVFSDRTRIGRLAVLGEMGKHGGLKLTDGRYRLGQKPICPRRERLFCQAVISRHPQKHADARGHRRQLLNQLPA